VVSQKIVPYTTRNSKEGDLSEILKVCREPLNMRQDNALLQFQIRSGIYAVMLF
jgi:hypothetical protein